MTPTPDDGTPRKHARSRRDFLKRSALLAGGLGMVGAPRLSRAAKLPLKPPAARPRVAAVVTEYRPYSHADVIVGRFLYGYTLDASPHRSPAGIHTLYADQFPPSDLSRVLSKHFRFPVTKTIREAILADDGKLAVDGVLLIGEHGNYPSNERGQRLYPRRRFFEETVAAFEEAGQVVPVFNDKHLAARWEDGRWMYEKARELGIPFLAGSSLPLCWRRPRIELPLEEPIEEALVVSHGGVESYGFHSLETLQCMVERRRGGETGVRAVRCLEGEAVWEAMDAGRFSEELLRAALRRHDPPLELAAARRHERAIAFLIEYRDGLRGTSLNLSGLVRHFLFAARLPHTPSPVATQFYLQEPGYNHFSYLSNAIAQMFVSSKPPYRVERTLLTTGILSHAMDSRFEGHRVIETPELGIAYKAIDHDLGAYRHPEACNERSGGWVELFDGRDLEGWRENRFAHEPRWEVSDGVLVGQGGQGYLATFEDFADLELFAELRILDTAGGRGNSGLYFRCQPHVDRAREYPPGYELQCDHGDSRNPTGSIYNLAVPGARASPPGIQDGEWFTLRLRAEGFHLRTWVNGKPAADCVDSGRRHRRGYILLQLHHQTSRVEFRELRVRRL